MEAGGREVHTWCRHRRGKHQPIGGKSKLQPIFFPYFLWQSLKWLDNKLCHSNGKGGRSIATERRRNKINKTLLLLGPELETLNHCTGVGLIKKPHCKLWETDSDYNLGYWNNRRYSILLSYPKMSTKHQETYNNSLQLVARQENKENLLKRRLIKQRIKWKY